MSKKLFIVFLFVLLLFPFHLFTQFEGKTQAEEPTHFSTFDDVIDFDNNIALRGDGSVWLYGSSAFLNLLQVQRINITVPNFVPPVPVIFKDGTPLDGVIAVESARTQWVALKDDGTVWRMGKIELNDHSEILDEPTQVMLEGGTEPLVDISSIHASNHSFYAIKEDGTVWSWGINVDVGLNSSRLLGDGTENDSYYPVQVMVEGIEGEDEPLTNVVMIDAGIHHVIALTESGHVFSWGSNAYLRLGTKHARNGSSPFASPTLLDGNPLNPLDEVTAVFAGDRHSFALRENGSLWAWGDRSHGRTGDGFVGAGNEYSEPTEVINDLNITSLSASRSTLAILDNGEVVAWGVGIGSEPTAVVLEDDQPLKDVQKVWTNTDTSFALMNDGTLKVWGLYGHLEKDPNTLDIKHPKEILMSKSYDLTLEIDGDGGVINFTGEGSDIWFPKDVEGTSNPQIWVEADAGHSIEEVKINGTPIETEEILSEIFVLEGSKYEIHGDTVITASFRSWGTGGGGEPNPPPQNNPTPNPTPAPPPPPVETTEELTVDVVTGDDLDGSLISKATILRTSEPGNGFKDFIEFDLDYAEMASNQLNEMGMNSARIVIPDPNDEVTETEVQTTMDAINTFVREKKNLEVYTENARIRIPHTSMAELDESLYFRIVPIRERNRQEQVLEWAKENEGVQEEANERRIEALGRPLVIETNMQGHPTEVVLPLHDRLPENVEQRQDIVDNLIVFIEHSDGTERIVRGDIAPYKDEDHIGMSFEIDKFSTFSLIYFEDWLQFIDINDIQDQDFLNNYYREAYIVGYEDGNFYPDRPITRAEIAAMLARNLENTPTIDSNHESFPDVGSENWAHGYIEQMANQKIMIGYPNQQFKPTQAITRAEMSIIIDNWVNTHDHEKWDVNFEDLIESSDEEYNLRSNLTRAEAVNVINRLTKRDHSLNWKEEIWPDVSKDYWAYQEISKATVDYIYKQGNDPIVILD